MYRMSLLELCAELDEKNVKDMKFLLKDVFGSRDLELAKEARDLIELLEKSGKISEGSNNYLMRLLGLSGIKRQDLVNKYFISGRLFLDQEDLQLVPPIPLFNNIIQPSSFPSQPVILRPSGGIMAPVAPMEFVAAPPLQPCQPVIPPVHVASGGGAEVLHRLADLKHQDEDVDEGRGSTESVGEETTPKESFAATMPEESFASTAPRESLASTTSSSVFEPNCTSVSADGIVLQEQASQESPQSSVAMTMTKNPISLIEKTIVESDATTKIATMTLNDLPSESAATPSAVSAVDLAMADDHREDYGVFDEQLPRHPITKRVDHDRILTQIQMGFDTRPYQRTLAEPGLTGENNIVVLQTG